MKKNTEEIIKIIYKKAKENKCEIIIPEDCVVSSSFEGKGKNKNLDSIEENEIILDIGPQTIEKIKKN